MEISRAPFTRRSSHPIVTPLNAPGLEDETRRTLYKTITRVDSLSVIHLEANHEIGKINPLYSRLPIPVTLDDLENDFWKDDYVYISVCQ